LTEISFVEDGESTILVSSAHDKTPQVRNGETGDWIGTFHGHKGAVWSAKIDALTRTLAATASGDFSARLWCANTGRELVEFKHKHVVKSVDFSVDSLRIGTGCQDGLLRVYDVCNTSASPLELKVVANTSNDGVNKISWSTIDRDIVFVGKKSSALEKWDVRQDPAAGPVVTTILPCDTQPVMDFDVRPEHNVILVAAGNRVVALSMDTLDVINSFEMPAPMNFHNEGGVAMHPHGSKFMAGGSDLWLREFDFATGEVLRTFKGHHGPVRCVRYHPKGDVVASGSEDGTIRLWDLNFGVATSTMA
jgi:serine-threonine kinase receptor-associated protein